MSTGIRVAHLSDVHFGPSALEEVQKCASAALSEIAANPPDVVLLSGDLFDHRLEAHAPAFRAAVQWVQQLADHAPVLVLQGTFSHDVPGTLEILGALGARFPIAVASEESAWALGVSGWENTTQLRADHRLAVFAWPPINRGLLAVNGDVNAAYRGYVSEVLLRARSFADVAREFNIPSLLTSHGTVNGCVTEHGQTLLSPDHELSTGELFSAGFDVVGLGHIHKHQIWESEGRFVGYAGSLARLHSGDYDAKGWIEWTVASGKVQFAFHTTPARDMIELCFDGAPDMESLQALAENSTDAIVRIRYTVNAEEANTVDRKAISALFSNAAVCKVEGTILPRLTARAPLIATTNGVTGKLALWASTQETPAPLANALGECLQLLLSESSDEAIAAALISLSTTSLGTSADETSTLNLVGV